MAEFYNRQIVSCLAVIFLQTFGGGLRPFSARETAVEIALAGLLLNFMFLIKISGFVLGLMILLAGCLLPGHTIRRLLNLSATLGVFGALSTIEFWVTGLEFIPVLRDYELAANARVTFSFTRVLSGMIAAPLVNSVALLLLFSVSQNADEARVSFRTRGLIIGSFAACQYALNMTNSSFPGMGLAPAAVTSLVACMCVKAVSQLPNTFESWWRKLTPSRLAYGPLREAIPLLIFALVLAPEVVASLIGIGSSTVVSLKLKATYVVTAGKGLSFKVVNYNEARQWNDAVTAIASLNLGHNAIINLDHANPFPVLFLAPPPKGIYRWDDFGYKLPGGAVLKWQDVIGDACVVTIPVNAFDNDVKRRLVDVVQSKLAIDFEVVYQDELWSIYRRTGDCGTA
jgi:hypothetical protein